MLHIFLLLVSMLYCLTGLHNTKTQRWNWEFQNGNNRALNQVCGPVCHRPMKTALHGRRWSRERGRDQTINSCCAVRIFWCLQFYHSFPQPQLLFLLYKKPMHTLNLTFLALNLFYYTNIIYSFQLKKCENDQNLQYLSLDLSQNNNNNEIATIITYLI